MDVICPRCGEPWDLDTLHDEARAQWEDRHPNISLPEVSWPEGLRSEYRRIFADVSGAFRTIGCAALHHVRGTDELCEDTDSDRALAAKATYSVLGDDLDGAAALLEDFGV